MAIASRIRRVGFIVGVFAALCGNSSWAQITADRIHIDIPAQGLSSALTQFGRVTGTEIVFTPESVEQKISTGIRGDFTREKAISLLLGGTGLTYRITSQGAMVIESSSLSDRRRESTSSASGAMADSRLALESGSRPETASGGYSASGAEQNTAGRSNLNEIVVTAQKRSERLQDVPVPVTALSADALAESNQLQLQDYYTKIPGLDFMVGNRGEPIAAIRGIVSIYGNPTIGIVVDDLPQGSSTANGGGYSAPDIDPSELARVEVLRGPQGTLYGATSMGGLIKYVTVDPSTEGVSGRLQVGVDDIYNGAQLGYSVRGAINFPLSDTVAVRASGFTREDPGYIDNIVSGQRGVNMTDAAGGRLAAIWKPTDDVSLKVSALAQDSKRHGSPQVDLGLGDLQQNNLPGTGWLHRENQAYSAILNVRFGSVNLTSLTGYNVYSFSTAFDLTPFFGSTAEQYFGVTGSSFPEELKNKRFSQEIRLSGPIGERFDWFVGGFFSDEHTSWDQIINAANAGTGMTVGQLDYTSYPNTYREYAVFTNLTFHLSDRFDIQVGGRESHDSQSFSQRDIGALQLEGGSIPTVRINEDAFTYLVTPEFKISPDLMVYARLASGYRPGGPNPPVPGSNVPPKFGPDKTANYELGVKGDALDHAISFDASLYYINWRNIQLSLFQNGFSYYANGGRAKSQGVELSVEAKPLKGLTIDASLSVDDAVLTQNLPAGPNNAYGVSGDPLPLTSRFSGHVSLLQDFPLVNRWTGFVGASESYVGDRSYNFQTTSLRQDYPAYAQTDLHAGARCDSWTLNVFANNVTDKRGVIGGGLGTIIPTAFDYIQPRSVGLSVAKSF